MIMCIETPRMTIRDFTPEDAADQKEELQSAPLLPYEHAISMLQHEDNRRILSEANAFQMNNC